MPNNKTMEQYAAKKDKIRYMFVMFLFTSISIFYGICFFNPIPVVLIVNVDYTIICVKISYEKLRRLKYWPILELLVSAVMFYLIYNRKLKGDAIELTMMGTFFSAVINGVIYMSISYERKKSANARGIRKYFL